MVLLLPMYWAPGLLGLLSILGLSGGLASAVLWGAVGVLAAVSTVNAVGTFHVREHVRDMAPWAATVAVLCILARVV